MKERDYNIPALHDYEKYGYKEEKLIGLKNWYKDYMTCSIKDSKGNLVGLDKIVYTLTPPAESDFKYNMEIEFNNEAENVIEEIRNLFSSIFNMFGAKV